MTGCELQGLQFERTHGLVESFMEVLKEIGKLDQQYGVVERELVEEGDGEGLGV